MSFQRGKHFHSVPHYGKRTINFGGFVSIRFRVDLPPRPQVALWFTVDLNGIEEGWGNRSNLTGDSFKKGLFLDIERLHLGSAWFCVSFPSVGGFSEVSRPDSCC